MVTPEEVARTAVKIFPIMGRLMDAYMRVGEHHLSSVHFQVLTMVLSRPCTVSELAERQSISAASMSKTVMVMEERGWLSRERDKSDRRIVRLAGTPAGRDVLRDVQRRSVEELTDAFKDLSQEELTLIFEGMEALIRAFSNSPRNGPSLLP
jgi:MarR family transcriptional regulator, 2-MHQ and catechol-resistance regulon repressor